MNELEIDDDGRYLGGEVPFGYTVWGDRLVEVPAELDAAVTAIRLVKQGKGFDAIVEVVLRDHGIELERHRFDALMENVYRRYGPI